MTTPVVDIEAIDVDVSNPTDSSIDIHDALLCDPVLAQISSSQEMCFNNIKAYDSLDQPIGKPTCAEKLCDLKQHSDLERELQIKKEVNLKDLSIEQLCLLLEDQNLQPITAAIKENEISGSQFNRLNLRIIRKKYEIVSYLHYRCRFVS